MYRLLEGCFGHAPQQRDTSLEQSHAQAMSPRVCIGCLHQFACNHEPSRGSSNVVCGEIVVARIESRIDLELAIADGPRAVLRDLIALASPCDRTDVPEHPGTHVGCEGFVSCERPTARLVVRPVESA